MEFRPGRFTPTTHWIGGWEVSRADLDAVEKGNMDSFRELIPDSIPSSPKPFAVPTEPSRMDLMK
jgi:hypothetical protein